MLYIKSSESYKFDQPIEINIEASFNLENRTYLLVRLEKSIFGQDYGYGEDDIKELFLLARHKGYDLSDLTKLPMDIYLLQPPKGFDRRNIVKDKLQNIAWSTLYG